MQHPTTILPGETVQIGFVPDYRATSLYVVTEGTPGVLHVTTSDGDVWALEPFPLESGLVRYGWPSPNPQASFFYEATPKTLMFEAGNESVWSPLAATLVNEETRTFLPVTFGNYRQIHSGRCEDL
jgi:hypothetical protein